LYSIIRVREHSSQTGGATSDGSLIYHLRPINMQRRDYHGRFRSEGRVTTRWEYVICLSILGGIFTGMYLDKNNLNPWSGPLVYTAEASSEALQEQPKTVLIKVVYDEAGIERLIRETFPETPNTAVAIAKAESELNPNAFNPEAHRGCNGSIGIFQMACVHNKKDTQALYDVETNIKMARELYLREGWKPWGAYTDGRWKQYLE